MTVKGRKTGVYFEKWVFKLENLFQKSVMSLIACQICLEQIGGSISSYVDRQLTILPDKLLKTSQSSSMC